MYCSLFLLDGDESVSAGDIYWEGEEDASHEFLEVKEEPLGVVGHLKRLKRGFFDWDFLSPSSSEPKKPAELTVDETEKDEVPTDDVDDNENELGSGFPDRGDAETEPKEKTLRVTFVVHQPYQAEYNKRDSYEFKSFSKSLADAVNQLYEKLPGTQRASLVRIQSRLANEFTCKVTLDIVTTGYDDTNRIADILQEHIRDTRALGSHAVNDADFNAVLIDPDSSLAVCAADEMTCDDGGCRSSSARCNGVPDCDDGSDEAGCPTFTEASPWVTDLETATEYNPEAPEQEQESEQWPAPDPDNNYDPDPERGDGNPFDVVTPAPAYPEYTTYNSRPSKNFLSKKPSLERADLVVNSKETSCRNDELRCDETRCLPLSARCDRVRDCDDGQDEQNCEGESLAASAEVSAGSKPASTLLQQVINVTAKTVALSTLLQCQLCSCNLSTILWRKNAVPSLLCSFLDINVQAR
ncbi:hypothetical protein O0L34_g2817 [Tuta absoluta]|nr:hypothetical protein O0L34_g2817 [Tuta absoluta]